MRSKSIIATLAIIAAGTIVVGCASTPVDANKWANAYYSQASTAEILRIQGTNISITVTGATSIALSTPIQPKQMMPRDPSTWEQVGDVLKTVAPWAVVGYLGAHGSYQPTPSIRGATTITLPAAPATTP